jgi:lysozyme family protein
MRTGEAGCRRAQLAEEIVAREGGFVNDPDDPGGATNFGVTIHTMRRLGLDLTGDGQVDRGRCARADPREQAVDIFIEHYYHRPRIDALPEVLQPSVFDMYVNAGANAVRILQRLLVDMGHDIAVDGVIGPQTIRAAQAAARQRPTISPMPMASRGATTTTPRRPPPGQPQIRAPPRWRQGRLDHPRRGIHQRPGIT